MEEFSKVSLLMCVFAAKSKKIPSSYAFSKSWPNDGLQDKGKGLGPVDKGLGFRV